MSATDSPPGESGWSDCVEYQPELTTRNSPESRGFIASSSGTPSEPAAPSRSREKHSGVSNPQHQHSEIVTEDEEHSDSSGKTVTAESYAKEQEAQRAQSSSSEEDPHVTGTQSKGKEAGGDSKLTLASLNAHYRGFQDAYHAYISEQDETNLTLEEAVRQAHRGLKFLQGICQQNEGRVNQNTSTISQAVQSLQATQERGKAALQLLRERVVFLEGVFQLHTTKFTQLGNPGDVNSRLSALEEKLVRLNLHKLRTDEDVEGKLSRLHDCEITITQLRSQVNVLTEQLEQIKRQFGHNTAVSAARPGAPVENSRRVSTQHVSSEGSDLVEGPRGLAIDESPRDVTSPRPHPTFIIGESDSDSSEGSDGGVHLTAPGTDTSTSPNQITRLRGGGGNRRPRFPRRDLLNRFKYRSNPRAHLSGPILGIDVLKRVKAVLKKARSQFHLVSPGKMTRDASPREDAWTGQVQSSSTILHGGRCLSQGEIHRKLKELESDPSREFTYRIDGVKQIMRLGEALQLPYKTIYSASVFLQMFRLRHKENEFALGDVVAANLILACKTEDTMKKSKEVLCKQYNLKMTDDQRTPDDKIFEKAVSNFIVVERRCLEAIGFLMEVHSPHVPAVKIIKSTLTRADAQIILPVVWSMLADLSMTHAVIKKTSTTLGFAVVELSSRLLGRFRQKIEALEPKDWSTYRQGILETMLDLLDLYTQHQKQTKIGPLYETEKFLEVKIALNQELDDSETPRFALQCHECDLPPHFARRSNGAAKTDHENSTTRFMFDADEAHEEETVMRKYTEDVWEEYEVEVEETIPIAPPVAPREDREGGRDRRFRRGDAIGIGRGRERRPRRFRGPGYVR